MELTQLIASVSANSPGEILRKQTTFMDIAIGTDSYRLNYRGKREFFFDKSSFKSFAVHAEHPLLIEYLEPMIPVHLASRVDDKKGFRELLEDALNDVFGKWRSLDRYLNLPLETFLKKWYGLLMTAPETFAKLAATRAKEIGVALILHEGHKGKGQPKVVLMDDNYVIADEFLVEPQGITATT